MARRLLFAARMLKAIVLASFLVGAFAAPAAADPSKTLQLDFKLSGANAQRHYALKLVSDSCGNIEGRAPDQVDKIKVCAHLDGGSDMRLEIDWETKHGDTELRNRSTVIAARGGSFELDGGSAKLGVTLQ